MDTPSKASGMGRDGSAWHLRPLSVSGTRESGFLFQAGEQKILPLKLRVMVFPLQASVTLAPTADFPTCQNETCRN